MSRGTVLNFSSRVDLYSLTDTVEFSVTFQPTLSEYTDIRTSIISDIMAACNRERHLLRTYYYVQDMFFIMRIIANIVSLTSYEPSRSSNIKLT